MTWLELAKQILNMPVSEMMKPVKVYDYNDEINKHADMIAAHGIESWNLDSPEDFMITFNSFGVYK